VTTYNPDRWVIVRIQCTSETAYKVLAGWGGGYLTGDSWQLNSGIARVEETPDHWVFHGHSGSVYKCGKSGYAMLMIMQGIWIQLKTRLGDRVVLMDEHTDWNSLVTDQPGVES